MNAPARLTKAEKTDRWRTQEQELHSHGFRLHFLTTLFDDNRRYN